MAELPFMEIYRHSEQLFIKSAIISWDRQGHEWDGLDKALFVPFLNSTLGHEAVTVDKVQEVLALLAQMRSIDWGTYEFDTHPKDPERADQENRVRDQLDDQINALIRGMT